MAHEGADSPRARTRENGRPDISKFATAESRRKGGLRSSELRRERARSHRQRVQDFIEEHYELMFDTYLRAMREGSADKAWQATTELWNQGYGKPAQEITGPDGGPLMGDAIEQGAERFLALVDTLVERAQRRLEHDQLALEQGTYSPLTGS